jgi:hypothetical protein
MYNIQLKVRHSPWNCKDRQRKQVSNPGTTRERRTNTNEVAATTTDAAAQKINTSQHGAEGTNTQPI